MSEYKRRPLRAFEFRAAVARLREIYPRSVITSTHRSASHNAAVGGGGTSKHLLSPLEPIACDLSWPDLHGDPPPELQAEMMIAAKVLGLWPRYHDGHLHLQGLAPGDIPEGWEP